jgi:formylglycine-generating enzyme required for sulfatase activity
MIAKSPEELQAEKTVAIFRAKFGENQLILASYAAFLLLLTHSLLCALRDRFVAREIKLHSAAVAMVLLSPLFREVDARHEVYEINPAIRQILLQDFSPQRLAQLGHFIITYLQQHPDFLPPVLQECQNLVAFAYIKPSEAARILTLKLTEAVQAPDNEVISSWVKLIKIIEKPLRQSGFRQIIDYNNLVNQALLKGTSLPDPYPLIYDLKQPQTLSLQQLKLLQETEDLQDTITTQINNTKKSEIIINFLNKFNIKLEELTREVITLELEEEKPEISIPWQLTTPYVNARGEISSQETLTSSYYEEFPPTPIRLVTIPEGQFTMGSQTEQEDNATEQPAHQVKIAGFLMSQTPITQAQWRAVASLPQEYLRLNPQPSEFRGENLPVDSVSWAEALEFCARLSRYSQKNYRLPSEAEWEYACRGKVYPQTDTPFHFGETLTALLANYNSSLVYYKESPGIYRAAPTPVGSFPPNAFGLYDMHGNVWEWCLDSWHENYHGSPRDGRAWLEGESDSYRDILTSVPQLIREQRPHVVRGGAWNYAPTFCRSAYRLFNQDLFRVGFRVLRDLLNRQRI